MPFAMRIGIRPQSKVSRRQLEGFALRASRRKGSAARAFSQADIGATACYACLHLMRQAFHW